MTTCARSLQGFFLTLFLSAILPGAALAGQAGAMLYPTKLNFEGNERSVTMTVKNNGDATGAYRIAITDFIMGEDGNIRPPAKGEDVSFSLKNFMRISPRRMELKPGESQTLRVMIRKPKDMETGEYRSHLRIAMIDNDVDATRLSAESADGAFNMRVATRVNFSIPVILRQGETDYSIEIAEKDLTPASLPAADAPPVLKLTFAKQGNRSVVGDVQVTHISGSGDATVVKYKPGITMYRQLPKLVSSIPLDLPEGHKLDDGKLKITYREQEDSGGNLIAETEIML